MTTVTDFWHIDYARRTVRCDAFGNNVAFDCPDCGHPMLAIIRENQRGSSVTNPSICRSCGFRCWLQDDPPKKILHLHMVRARDKSPHGQD
jgi:predicted RNA-binding Zn-ribbon protein involved in translation (DUF1610 family)